MKIFNNRQKMDIVSKTYWKNFIPTFLIMGTWLFIFNKFGDRSNFPVIILCLGIYVCHRIGTHYAMLERKSEKIEEFIKENGLSREEFRWRYRKLLDILDH